MPGIIIKKIREKRKLTQEYVALQMGLSQNALSKIENNYTALTVKHLKDLSRILEVSILDLMKEDFEIHKPSSMQMESVSRDNLIEKLLKMSERLKNKNPIKHENYPLIFSMLQTIDNSIDNIH
jgi:transcriptional regulator with XRE-family HTH domain